MVISEVGDAALVALDGHVIGSHGGLPPQDRYSAHYPLEISIPSVLLDRGGSTNELLVLVRHVKRAQVGITRGPVAIVRSDDAFKISRRTLAHNVIVPLVVGLGTLILGLLTLFGVIFSQAKNPKLSAYLRYCAAASFFSMSYTCLPREVLPLSATGCIHFLLRFLMDWSFFELALQVTGWRPGLRWVARPIYGAVLSVLILQFVLEPWVLAHASHRQGWMGFTGAVGLSRLVDFVLILGAYLYGAIGAYKKRAQLPAAVVVSFGVTSALALSGCLTFHGVVSLPHL